MVQLTLRNDMTAEHLLSTACEVHVHCHTHVRMYLHMWCVYTARVQASCPLHTSHFNLQKFKLNYADHFVRLKLLTEGGLKCMLLDTLYTNG